jgi:hypothetical protein
MKNNKDLESLKLNMLIAKGVFSNTASLDKYNFANLFNVVNKGEKSYFNLYKNVTFDISDLDPELFENYQVMENDSWTNISYKFYGTIKLWWLICKFNNIKNPFTELTPGKILKIPVNELMENVLDVIQVR